MIMGCGDEEAESTAKYLLVKFDKHKETWKKLINL